MRTWLAKMLRISLCEHQWKTIETCTVSCHGRDLAKVYIQQCTKCGAMHNHRAGAWD